MRTVPGDLKRETDMWYVIRVESRKEEEALFFMNKILDMDSLGRAFIPDRKSVV